MIGIGEFDTLIIVETGLSEQGEMGGISEMTWEEGPKVWAKMEMGDGKTSIAVGAQQETNYIEFTIQAEGVLEIDKIKAMTSRVAYPLISGFIESGKTQYYNVTGIRNWGGRKKYKTIITSASANENPL